MVLIWKKPSLHSFEQCLPLEVYNHNNQHPTSIVCSPPLVLRERIANQLLNGKEENVRVLSVSVNFFAHT